MKKELKWLFSYIEKYKLATGFIVLTAILEPVISLLPLYVTADVVGLLINNASFFEILKSIVRILPIALIQGLVSFTGSYTNEVLAHRITTDMTEDLFVTMQHRSLSYHDRKDVGDIMARATNDTRTINIALSPGIRMAMMGVLIWFVAAWILYEVKPFLAIITISIFALFFIVLTDYSKRLNPISRQVLAEFSKLSKITENSLSSIHEIKSFIAENKFKRKYAKQAHNLAKIKEKEGILGALHYPQLITSIFVLVMGSVSLILAYNNQINIPQLTLVITSLVLLEGFSYELDWISFYLVAAYAAIRRLIHTIGEEDPGRYIDGDIEYDGSNSEIEFRNVTFSYDKTLTPALVNVSFKIPDKQTLAIVGAPGSGKTTITKLIERLYVPQQGEILLGQKNIMRYTNKSLRKHIATVEQDIFLFNDTILENIRFGKPNATFEEVVQAAKLAVAHDFIMAMPKGYDTVIGENGVKLSGGQAQRIAIARALLMNPSILLIDDAASALDAKTELKIQEAIKNIIQARTTIITTHRLAIISRADAILLMDKGRIVGYGTHEKLIKTNYYYRRLFERHYELPPLEAQTN